MRLDRMRLGQKLGAVLLLLMLSVAMATAGLVYMGFERTQRNARESSQAGLEELGIRLIAEMARAQSELGVQQLENASRLGQEMARYFVDFKGLAGSPQWDTSRLVVGSQG